jgi:hypothetical protein
VDECRPVNRNLDGNALSGDPFNRKPPLFSSSSSPSLVPSSTLPRDANRAKYDCVPPDTDRFMLTSPSLPDRRRSTDDFDPGSGDALTEGNRNRSAESGNVVASI